MNFSLNEHQSIWKKKASRFTDHELRPSWRELESNRSAPAAAYKKAGDVGLFEICSSGGQDGGAPDLLALALVTEELAKGDCGFALMFVNRYLASRVAQLPAGPGFRDGLWARIANSRKGTEIAFLWPEIVADNSAAANVTEETARPTGTGAIWNESLSCAHSGVECFVGYGRIDSSDPLPGHHLVLVERDRVEILDECQGAFSRDSLRCYRLHLGEARDLKVVKLKDGHDHDRLIGNLSSERLTLFYAMALGLAGAAFDYALAYSGERMAFGRPILQHQAVSLRLAEIYINLEAARLLLWKIASEGAGDGREAHAALNYGHGVAFETVSSVMRILGGHGYLQDHPAEKWMREIQFLRLVR